MLAVTGDHECKVRSAKCEVQDGQASWLSATIDHRPSSITYDRRSSRSCLEAGPLKRGWQRAAASPHALPILFLVAANLAFFGHLLFTRAILHGSGTDVVSFQYQVLQYAREQLLAGHFPLWNPHIFGGHPFHAMGQAGLTYPPNWLLMLPGAFAWIKLSVALHALLGSVLAYSLAFRWMKWGGTGAETAAPSALIAGLCFSYGGFFVLHAYAGHVNLLAAAAWLPGLWLALYDCGRAVRLRRPGSGISAEPDRASARQAGPDADVTPRKHRTVAAAALCLAMMILAGSPQVVLLGLSTGIFWYLGPLLVRHPCLRDWAAALGWLALALAAGLTLAAVQLLPMLELAGWSARAAAGPGELTFDYSLPRAGAWNILCPWFWGHVEAGWWAQHSRWEFASFVGTAPALLATAGLLLSPRRTWPLAAGFVACLLLALGGNTPVYPFLARTVPLLDSFRVPARFLLPGLLFLSLAAAAALPAILASATRSGLDSGRSCLLRSAPAGSTPLWRKAMHESGWTVIGFGGAAGLLFWLFASTSPERIPGWVEALVSEHGNGTGPEALRTAARFLRAGFLQELILVGCAAVLIGTSTSRLAARAQVRQSETESPVAPQRPASDRPLPYLISLVVFVGLLSAGHGLLHGGNPGLYKLSDPARKLLSGLGSHGRLLYYESRGWNKLMATDFINLAGYDPSLGERMNRFANVAAFGEEGVEADKTWALWPSGKTALPSRLLDLAGVTHLLTSRPGAFARAGWKAAAREGSLYLLANAAAAPAFYCATELSLVASPGEAASRMLASAGKGRLAAVVEPGEATWAGGASPCQVSKVETRAEQLVFDLLPATGGSGSGGGGAAGGSGSSGSDSGGSGSSGSDSGGSGSGGGGAAGGSGSGGGGAEGHTLVVAGQSYPGWECRVDGERAPSAPANLVSTACAVSPGARRVVFGFRSRSFEIGLALSLLTAAALAFWWIWARRRERKAMQEVVDDA
jgi:hypothetical protein